MTNHLPRCLDWVTLEALMHNGVNKARLNAAAIRPGTFQGHRRSRQTSLFWINLWEKGVALIQSQQLSSGMGTLRDICILLRCIAFAGTLWTCA